MKREKSLLKNTFILALGTYLPKLTTIITLPLLTGYLSKAEYGTYDLITTLVSLLLPALTLQIQSAAFRFLISCRDNREKITVIVTNIFSFTIPISLIGLIITYFCLGSLSPDTKILMLLYFFVDILYTGVGQVARGLGKNFIYATGSVIVSVTNMIGICITLLVLQMGLNGLLISMAVACLIGNILLVWRVELLSYFSLKAVSIQRIKELLTYSWPMVPNALSNWVLSLSDRLVILNVLGVESNAIYAVANKIPNLVKTFQGTFTSAWQENASISVNDDDSETYYSKMFDSINCIVVGLVAGLIAFTPILFSLLIKGSYDEAYQQMPLLYIGMYFSCMSGFLGGIYIAHMRTKSVGITTLCAAACNLIINLVAIQYIGLYAASLSTMVAYAFLFIFRLFNVKTFQPLKVNYLKLLGMFTIITAMSILAAQRVFWINIANGIVGVIFALLINNNLVRTLFSTMAKKMRKFCMDKKEEADDVDNK